MADRRALLFDLALAGLVQVGLREADDLLRAAEEFLEVVSGRLGLPVSDHRGLRLASTRTA